ncbi:4-aminobutyrate---pyruvate transaminase [Aureimonas altamirensis DSM 21988]|uniref:Class III aminotransferase n=2 Tax=Aureimonas altamirensis TaxID=370622 RepID=A0A0P0YW49_9HYPH|nr:aspartate aminotransferase family protein [Aureimonas altamirensis]BAT25606.1 class III aminotransferase [Aureimonas altamirensis]SHI41421.1 4-aminobutyrate---pyruvate transaminase [Aureimonas altamirensis DSM 21988]
MSAALPNSVYARDVEYILHPVTNARKHEETGPIVIDRGEGIYVFDDQGKQYIEAMAGLWSVAVGFGEKRIADAAYAQLQKLPYYHTFSHKTNEPSVDLAETVVKMTPASVNRVFFTNSGSEANDTVVKLIWYYNNARGRPEKKKFLSRQNAYHGITMVSGSLTGLPVNHRDFDLPIIPVRHLTCPHYWRFGQPGETEAQFTERLAQELEDTIAAEGADTIAAFIGEPLMGAGGVLPPPEGYWARVQEICRKHDILIVADEVINGFGRLGTTFACEYYDIQPDVLVTSKQIASSYAPLAAVLISDAIYQGIADNTAKIGTLGHGFTTTGHPVSCAIANENLAIIRERNLVENAARSGAVLQEELKRFQNHPLVGDVRGVGLIAAVELVADKATKTRFDPVGRAGGTLFVKGHEHGVIIRAIGDQIAFCPPLIITEDEVREMVARFGKALDDTYAALKADGVVA